jgi:hypothetical protein
MSEFIASHPAESKHVFSRNDCAAIFQTKSLAILHCRFRHCTLHRPGSCPHCFRMSIGFKEWTLICDAIGRGEQSIILRKGGIAEGRAGFRFQHDEFLLFPTLFHEQVSKLKLPPETPLPVMPADADIEIKYRVKVEWTEDLTDLAAVQRLAPFHLWKDEVIEERFRYDEKQGVSLAFVRAEVLTPAFVFPTSPRYGGCRSWVNLPELPAETTATLALDESAHRAREKQIRALL